MAQTTSELWKQLLEMDHTIIEYAHEINGVWYDADSETASSVSNDLFAEVGIGNANCAKLELNIFAEEIPKGAQIKRYIRLKNGDTVSEWLPKGTYYANRRANDDGYWTIEAFDAMLKTEQDFLPATITDTWPRAMTEVANDISTAIAVPIDARTYINPAYTLPMPVGYTMRQVLGHIAAAHGGNWIITANEELCLVPLLSAPAETSNLVTERGQSILFGGVRIIV